MDTVSTYLREIGSEVIRVSWAPKDLWRTSAVGVLTVLLMVLAFFAAVDFILSILFRRMLS